MCVVIKSRPEFKMGHVGSKTRSLGQFLGKPCVLCRRHSFDPVFMKLCRNDFLTLNKHLSRRAMLSDDSSCLNCEASGLILQPCGNFLHQNLVTLVTRLLHFSCYKMEFFSFQNNPKNLDPSYKMDLDPLDCLGWVKHVL